MAKKIVGYIKFQITAGKATPAPPVGPALGQKGLNIMEFCKAFNAQTANMGEVPVPVVITAYADRTFSFILKRPPLSFLIRQAAGLKKGSATTGRGDDVGFITRSQAKEIAENKMVDMNAYSIEAAIKMVEGSARSQGISVKD